MVEDRSEDTGRRVSWFFASLFVLTIGIFTYSWGKTPVVLTLMNCERFNIPIQFSLRLDFLSTLVLAMISLLTAVISIYANYHFKGERNRSYFYKYFILTVMSVYLMVASSNLIQFFLMWIGTSLGLHQLLLFHPERPQAVNAARKKFMISRLGDLSLIAAIALTYRVFNSFEFEEIFAQLNSSFQIQNQEELRLITLLFSLGAMTKSAQLPFHFWLPETMETPSPVSALMHAGIINAGGFLVIRLSPLFQAGLEGQFPLILVGACTAVFGSLVMMTQNHIKQKLAYSTISQMGMMMFACGIGAYSLALFHMVAHSFYKAYAFLTTGMQIRESRRSSLESHRHTGASLLTTSLAGLTLVLMGFVVQGGRLESYFLYFAILLLGLFQNPSLIFRKRENSSLSIHREIKLACAIFAFIVIEVALHEKLSGLTLFSSNFFSISRSLVLLGSYGVFALGLFLSEEIVHPQTALAKKLYFFLWNGGYFSLKSDAIVQRFYRTLPKNLPTEMNFRKGELHAET